MHLDFGAVIDQKLFKNESAEPVSKQNMELDSRKESFCHLIILSVAP